MTSLICASIRARAAALRTRKALAMTGTSVRIPCNAATHERAKSDWSSLRNSRPWPDAGLVVAECPHCNSTLARDATDEEAKEAA